MNNKTLTSFMQSNEIKAIKDFFSISIDFLSDLTKNSIRENRKKDGKN